MGKLRPRRLLPISWRFYESAAGGYYCMLGSFGKLLCGVWVKREQMKLRIEVDW
jgi:hypothetical protein